MQVRQRSDKRVSRLNSGSEEGVAVAAQERVLPGGQAAAAAAAAAAASAPASYSQAYQMNACGNDAMLDMDVTVLAFAQWVSGLKKTHGNAHKSLQIELNTIKNAINGNHSDLSDFKRHGAAIQQQMQAEISEIRESLSSVFMEITAAVRNNAAADQDLKMKIQSLNEQAVRNETAFAQLTDAADQSQTKLRSAVVEMQKKSEAMRDELVLLTQHTDSLQVSVHDRSERLQSDIDLLHKDLRTQIEKRKTNFQKMVYDVVNIGESLQTLNQDFLGLKQGASNNQSKLQSSLYSLDQSSRRDVAAAPSQAMPACQGQPQRVAQYALPGAQPVTSLPGVSVMMPYQGVQHALVPPTVGSVVYR
eukprot:TRINITY_DN6534_c0_g1_i1.p1 TRINITY_DN6534_c0_g1~~TRINITY_DN6534_c0_g1_i1.p1  ORF type:complete len:361 (-),score=89.94 TRINITY_DN6534_c0_g1_i1:293-1375(-)